MKKGKGGWYGDRWGHRKAALKRKRTIKGGRHVYAKVGKNENYRPVYVISISKGIAHISWSYDGINVIDGHVPTKYLKYKNT